MFLRQVALVAGELEPVVDDLRAALAAEVAYRDPGVKVFGLENAVMPLGDTFLEVVSPVAPDAPARRYRERRGGDAGYMVMLQTDAFDADRARLEARGVRIAWSAELPDIRGMHLHPRDTGGALLSLDQPEPPGSWRWAGPAWQEHVLDPGARLRGATLACRDPETVAHRWGELLERPVTAEEGGFRLSLDREDFVRFEPGAGPGGDGLVAFRVRVSAPEDALGRAAARGLPVDVARRSFVACGTHVEIE